MPTNCLDCKTESNKPKNKNVTKSCTCYFYVSSFDLTLLCLFFMKKFFYEEKLLFYRVLCCFTFILVFQLIWAKYHIILVYSLNFQSFTSELFFKCLIPKLLCILINHLILGPNLSHTQFYRNHITY